MLAALVAIATAQLVNKNVNRVVDLTTQIAKVCKTCYLKICIIDFIQDYSIKLRATFSTLNLFNLKLILQ